MRRRRSSQIHDPPKPGEPRTATSEKAPKWSEWLATSLGTLTLWFWVRLDRDRRQEKRGRERAEREGREVESDGRLSTETERRSVLTSSLPRPRRNTTFTRSAIACQAQAENDEAKEIFEVLNEQYIQELPILLDLRIRELFFFLRLVLPLSTSWRPLVLVC